MARMTFKETVNLICICCVIVSFFSLLFFWESFTWAKAITLIFLIAAFMLVLFKNGQGERRVTRGMAELTELPPQRYQDSTSARLTEFFQRLGGNSYGKVSSRWNLGLTYSSQIQASEYASRSSAPLYSSSRYLTTSSQLQPRMQLNIFIPQQINSIMQEIKRCIHPNKFFRAFKTQVQKILDKKLPGNKYAEEKKFYEELAPRESFFLEKGTKLLMVENYDVVVDGILFTGEIVSEFMEGKIDNVIRSGNRSFKVVSETVMKCFGLRVNFGAQQRNNSYNPKQVSVEELTDFLIRFRRQNIMSQKFKLIIPFRDFVDVYLERLIRCTDDVFCLLQHMDNDTIMAFRVYVDVLNDIFAEDILMTNDKSAYSPELRKVRHVFYVHQSGKSVFFTYNRIKGFKTKNPLVALMAFLTEVYKMGKYLDLQIMRELDKRFTDRPIERSSA